MKYTYSYPRNKIGNHYDLENVVKFNGDVVESNSPSDEIKTALPGKNFKLFGNDDVLECVFDEKLNVSEKSVLDGIINNNRKT